MIVNRNYRFTFPYPFPFEEAESALLVARVAAEGILGEARVRLDDRHTIDRVARGIDVDASTSSGVVIVGVFTALLICEFGDQAFHVERIAEVAGTRPHAVA
jgi:hypothetical protein